MGMLSSFTRALVCAVGKMLSHLILPPLAALGPSPADDFCYIGRHGMAWRHTHTHAHAALQSTVCSPVALAHRPRDRGDHARTCVRVVEQRRQRTEDPCFLKKA